MLKGQWLSESKKRLECIHPGKQKCIEGMVIVGEQK